ncbi:MAG: prepilin-type N-terminal cleavage/methylation domain-containing protein, partial [Patescibacteria group bacterium]|nr:prepilin-type N-terminal cleavage/methylation domain-containing protein [Patescibacteria group bacterium]
MKNTIQYNGMHNINRGYTLVELVVAISIMLVVMLSVVAFEYNVLDYNRSSKEALNNITDAENILKYMTKELRTMSPSASGSYPILNAATSSITFYSDVDGDGVKDQVRYYLVSTTLYRGVTAPVGSPPSYNSVNEKTVTLAQGVRNGATYPVFEYFDGNYDGDIV